LLILLIGIVLASWRETKSEQIKNVSDDKKSIVTLMAHYPLIEDTKDVIGSADGEAENVEFGVWPKDSLKKSAMFNGRNSRIKVNNTAAFNIGKKDFSLALWVRCRMPLTSTLGDLVSKFDPDLRKGINLHISGSSPAYSAMSDTRHVHFGIDDASTSLWEDYGKPWPSNSLISNLVTFENNLYCGIADADKPQSRAHVFRLGVNKNWIDCGRLGDNENHHSVMSLAVHNGKLYAGTGIWDWVQALGGLKGAPLPAPTRVFVYEGGVRWKDLGQVGNGSRILCLASYNGNLFAGLDSVGGGKAFKYDGNNWIDCGAPDGKNFECFLPMQGKLFASTHGNIYEYKGAKSWLKIGSAPFDINQIHSMQVFAGKMILGTWPQGYVLRYDGSQSWSKIGRLGLPEGPNLINEVMDLTVYNGKLYAGLIPKAEVYRFEKDNDWTQLGSLAKRSDWDVKNVATWARITCLTCFQGKLFAGTGSCQGRSLDSIVDPSLGRVFAMQAGAVASHERDIGGAWTHIAAIRRGPQIQLFVNGKLTASSPIPSEKPFDLDNKSPLWFGFGAQNYFDGTISNLRFYQGALDIPTITSLADPNQ